VLQIGVMTSRQGWFSKDYAFGVEGRMCLNIKRTEMLGAMEATALSNHSTEHPESRQFLDDRSAVNWATRPCGTWSLCRDA